MSRPIAILALAAAGCATGGRPSAPAEPPALELELRHYFGDALGGPRVPPSFEGPAGLAASFEGAWAVTLETHWIPAPVAEALPELEPDRLEGRASLVVSSGDGGPLLAAPQLAGDAGLVLLTEGSPAESRAQEWRDEHDPLGRLTGLLRETHTLALELGPPDAGPDAEKLVVELARDEDTAALSLLAVGTPEQGLSLDEDGGLVPRSEQLGPRALLAEQRVLLEQRVQLDDVPRLLLLPDPNAPRDACFAVLTELRLATEDEIERLADQVAAQCLGDPALVERSAVDGRGIALGTASRALAESERRSALGFLALETDAQLVGDLVLIADDALIDTVADRALDDLAFARLDAPADLGWVLEREAFTLLTEMARAEQLSPALDALLLRHGGELGRLPSVLSDAVAGSKSLAALRARLVQENGVLLEDPDPAARRRAFRFLDARGVAPAGFDPFADAAERRSVLLEAAAQARAQEQRP